MEPIIISEAQEQKAADILAEHRRFLCEVAKWLNTTLFSDADKAFLSLHLQWQAGPKILSGGPAPTLDETIKGRAIVALSKYATDITLSENALVEFDAKKPETKQ